MIHGAFKGIIAFGKAALRPIFIFFCGTADFPNVTMPGLACELQRERLCNKTCPRPAIQKK